MRDTINSGKSSKSPARAVATGLDNESAGKKKSEGAVSSENHSPGLTHKLCATLDNRATGMTPPFNNITLGPTGQVPSYGQNPTVIL